MLRTLFALALGIAVTVQGAPEPEALAKLEGWEGIYDTKVACLESFSGDDLCKKVAEMVDFSTVVLTSNTTYLIMSKAGNDWPFYGFRVALEPGG
ncbi:MAG: hypothetical protein HYR96_00580, partial [Deltaproteobacteria bacterium]|nr:hypothetical protein [Deltaproteobacteria bacterium]